MTGRMVAELGRARRSLGRSPLFAGTAVGLLALGIGGATAIFTVVDGVLLEPLPLPEADRLVSVCERHPSLVGYCVASPPTMVDLGREGRTLESVGLARGWAFGLAEGGRRLPLRSGLATPGFFRALGATAAVGRLFAPDEVGEDARVVLLGHEAWTTWFGADPDVVGRPVALDGEPHVVVGVLAPGVELPTLPGVQLWRPLHFDPAAEEQRSWRGFEVLGRLARGRDVAEARAELSGLYDAGRRERGDGGDAWRLAVLPLQGRVVADVRPTLLVFLGAVGVLLLIACANVAGLLLVRSARRERDRAVRVALGAGRVALVGGVLAESAILALAGGLAGLGLARLGTEAFLALAPPGIPRLDEVGVDGSVFLFALAASVGAVLVFGLLPALRTGGSGLAEALARGAPGAGGAGGRVRGGLVVGEVALAATLLATAVLLARSFAGYLAWEPGFDRDGLAALSVFFAPEVVGDEPLADLLARTEAAAEGVPGVQGAAFASSIPLLGGRETLPWRLPGAPAVPLDELPRARVSDVSPDYFSTLGVELVAGRPFAEGERAGGEPVLVVNETFARRAWPDGGALGRRLTVPGGVWAEDDVSYRIVGVVADVPPLTPGEGTEPEAYRSNRQYARAFPFLVVRAEDDPGGVAARVRARLLAELGPDLGVTDQGSMATLLGRRLVRPRFDAFLLGAFAAAALLLTLVGVYGVLAYAVLQRDREIGIRLALGSSRGRVAGSVLAEGLRLGGLGVALGVGGSLAAGGVVAGAVHGVEADDPATLAICALVVLALVAAASLVPALRAGRRDPASLLRDG